MDIRREWKRAVPEFGGGPFTLDDLVNDFIRRRTDPRSPLYKNRDDIVDWCMESDSLRDAVVKAVLSIRPNGKVHNHQSRVSIVARKELGRRMLADKRWMRRASKFEAVLERIEGYKVAGIGPVTAYDVCTRVCAYLGLEPTALHLHAGCLAGYRALLPDEEVRAGEYVNPKNLPGPLQRRLKPDEVEDFLCVYREVLADVQR